MLPFPHLRLRAHRDPATHTSFGRKGQGGSSAQGAYFFYNGMFLGLMTLASGYLYAWLGLSSYYVMSGVAAFGLAMVVVARSLQPQSLVSGGKTSVKPGAARVRDPATAAAHRRGSTNSASCAKTAGAMASDVPTMQPIKI